VTKRYARVLPQQASLIDSDQPIPVEKWRKTQTQSKSEQLHDKLAFDCRTHGLPDPVLELRFAKLTHGRQWRFDFSWPDYMVTAEIEGLVVKRALVAHLAEGSPKAIVVSGRVVNAAALRYELKPELVSLGRHASPDGFIEDTRKYNTAAELGWTVLRFHQSSVQSREAVETIVRVLSVKGWRA
jgi:hypothetical protein